MMNAPLGSASFRSIFPTARASKSEQIYFREVDAAFEAKEDRIISNGEPAHAVYILHKLLEGAKHSVGIYTGGLAQTFGDVLAYGDPMLAESAAKFLSKESSELTIIIAENPDVPDGRPIGKHPFLDALSKAEIQGKLKVAKASEIDRKEIEFHFVVMDNEAVRIETDTTAAKAYANFGKPDLAARFGEFFRLVERDSTALFSLPSAA